MLKCLGFGPKFYEQVNMLFVDANAKVVVNGTLSLQFPLQNFICQGCPLAPYLFVLVVDAIGYLFEHALSNELIHDISLSNSTLR